MIAYFDTSALVPLLIAEPGTIASGEIWDRADRLVSIRLARVEAHAALARASRLGRISADQHRLTKRNLEHLMAQLDLIDIDDDLVDHAADLAERQSLRAYDAVHLAAVQRIFDHDVVFVAGDHDLLAAARAIGISTAIAR